jgi:hypothetical protein
MKIDRPIILEGIIGGTPTPSPSYAVVLQGGGVGGGAATPLTDKECRIRSLTVAMEVEPSCRVVAPPFSVTNGVRVASAPPGPDVNRIPATAR